MKFEKQAKASSWDGIVNRKGADRTFIPVDQRLSLGGVGKHTLYIGEWKSFTFRA